MNVRPRMNPWANMHDGAAKYHRADAPFLAEFDENWGAREPSYRLQLHLEPEPFVGDFERCSIVFLGCNPLYLAQSDAEHHEDEVRGRLTANRLHAPSDHPFLHLDPLMWGYGGGKWWLRALQHVIPAVTHRTGWSGNTLWRNLSERIASADLYAYHAEKGYPVELLRSMPSSRYTYSLVRGALRRGALLVSLWKTSSWVSHWNKAAGLPPSDTAAILRPVHKPRRGVDISSQVYGQANWERIVQALSDAA